MPREIPIYLNAESSADNPVRISTRCLLASIHGLPQTGIWANNRRRFGSLGRVPRGGYAAVGDRVRHRICGTHSSAWPHNSGAHSAAHPRAHRHAGSSASENKRAYFKHFKRNCREHADASTGINSADRRTESNVNAINDQPAASTTASRCFLSTERLNARIFLAA